MNRHAGSEQPHLPSLPTDRSIRVLSVAHSPSPSQGGTREYRLTTIHLDESSKRTPYQALSYRWSDLKAEQPIIVNGSPVIVMQTVKDFLDLHWNRPRCGPIFIDSICINQQDLEERASQVRLMGLVYKLAVKVCSWIGADSPKHDTWYSRVTCHPLALRFASSERRRQVAQLIFWRQYWSRAWVLQELINARKIEVYWGKTLMTEGDLLTLAEHGRTDAHKTFLKSMTAVLQRAQESKTRSLARLLIMYEYTSATDVRDKVYALLGMVSDAPQFPIDYAASTTVSAVYCNVMAHCNRVNQSPHVCMAFARVLSVSLDIQRPQIVREPQALHCFVAVRGWVVCMVKAADALPKPQRSPGMHSFQQYTSVHGSLDAVEGAAYRTDKHEQGASSVQGTALQERLGAVAACPEHATTGRMLVYVLSHDLESKNLSTSSRSLMPPEKRYEMPCEVEGGIAQSYECEDPRAAHPSYGAGITATSRHALHPGDVICRFQGVPKTLALREIDGAYRPVGVATLEGGALDLYHFPETEGSPLEIIAPEGPSFLFSMNVIAVGELALFG